MLIQAGIMYLKLGFDDNDGKLDCYLVYLSCSM